LKERNIVTTVEFLRERIKPLVSGKSLHEATAIFIHFFHLSASVEEVMRQRLQTVTRLYQEQLEYMPGFLTFFEKAQLLGLPTAVATSSHADLLAVADTKLGFKKLFQDHVYDVSLVENKGKPDPAIFLYAAQQLGVIPAECVVIEDGKNGVEAAKRAGMFVIGITTSMDRMCLEAADLVVDTFEEIDLASLTGR
jgi:HAD superfamily hydrolase (TIGR01509 family)